MATRTTRTSTPAKVARAPLAKSIRAVSVSFEAISFEGSVHGAAVDQDERLDSFCANEHPASKIRQVTSCPACSNRDRDTFRKGKERGGEVVLVDKDKYAAVKARDEEYAGKLEVSVVEADDEQMVPIGSKYYLGTKSRTGTGYPLLAALIRKRPKLAFLAELSTGGAPRLFRLFESDGVIVMRELARPEALREAPSIAAGTIRPEVLERAEELVDMSVVPFDPHKYRNVHAETVATLVDEAQPATATGVAREEGEDFLELLSRSISERKKRKPTTRTTTTPRRSAASRKTG